MFSGDHSEFRTFEYVSVVSVVKQPLVKNLDYAWIQYIYF